MKDEKTEELTLEKLKSLDKASMFALAILATKALEASGKVIFAVDVLGRIQIMSPEAVEFKSKPKVSDGDLDEIGEDEVIRIMMDQGDSEEDIIFYFKGREERLIK